MSLFMPSKIQKYSLVPNLGRKSLMKIAGFTLAIGIAAWLVFSSLIADRQLALIASVGTAAVAGLLSYFYYLRAPGGLSVSEYMSLMMRFFKGQRRFFYVRKEEKQWSR